MKTIKRDIVGAFIFSADNRVLLGHAGVFEGQWCVPGGGIEEGESEYDAVMRETLEETGIDATEADISRFDDTFPAASEKTLRDTGERVMVNMIFIDYVIRLPFVAREVEIVCNDDFTDGRWFTPEELTEESIAEGTSRRLVELGFLALEQTS